ncbi:MAG TPA: hypothetical protein EYO45_05005 [Candidatus Marinimicrobia bacterium]|nr:hypothetical protein [Candidatus Neomarinimicrobiota bacterium]
MSLRSLSKEDLRMQLFAIQDEVSDKLKVDPDVDKFLDHTDLFDEWEKVLPDAEYPIFVMAVLNNVRRKVIIETILNSILDDEVTSGWSNSDRDDKSVENTDHPFC